MKKFGINKNKHKNMKLEVFKEIVSLIKKQEEDIDKIYVVGIDLINIIDPINSAVSHLIGAAYGTDGKETFEWWCYDNEWGAKGLSMWNKDGTVICKTIEDLHEYLEENKDDDYALPIKLSDEERQHLLIQMFSR
jgi:hypothetical protein